jgi:probable F420-dependent oxidoreductase
MTSTIRLGTAMLVLPQRHPAVVAKQVATLDVLSGGRVELGVGAGWLKEEFDQLGVTFESRGRRLEAYIAAMRALWETPEATVTNEFVALDRAVCSPRPTQSLPIHLGGDSATAARRAGRIGQGYFPGARDVASCITIMREEAERAGRDPGSIEVTCGRIALGPDPLEIVAAYADLGINRLCIVPPTTDIHALPDALKEFSETVMKPALATNRPN